MKGIIFTLLVGMTINGHALTETEFIQCNSQAPSPKIQKQIEESKELFLTLSKTINKTEEFKFITGMQQISKDSIDCASMFRDTFEYTVKFAKTIAKNIEYKDSIEKIGNYGVIESDGVLLEVSVNLGTSCYDKKNLSMTLENMIYMESRRYIGLMDKSSSTEKLILDGAESVNDCFIGTTITETQSAEEVKILDQLVEDFISKN